MKNNVRKYRLMEDISQQELADKTDVSRQSINNIERERYTPSVELALKISKALKCSVEDLFTL